MTKLAYPAPSSPQIVEDPGVKFSTDGAGAVSEVTVQVGIDGEFRAIVEGGWVTITNLGRDRLSAREAVLVAWALSVLAANERTRW